MSERITLIDNETVWNDSFDEWDDDDGWALTLPAPTRRTPGIQLTPRPDGTTMGWVVYADGSGAGGMWRSLNDTMRELGAAITARREADAARARQHVTVRHDHIIDFPNGVTATYNTWAEQILLTPRDGSRIVGVQTSTNKVAVTVR